MGNLMIPFTFFVLVLSQWHVHNRVFTAWFTWMCNWSLFLAHISSWNHQVSRFLWRDWCVCGAQRGETTVSWVICSGTETARCRIGCQLSTKSKKQICLRLRLFAQLECGAAEVFRFCLRAITTKTQEQEAFSCCIIWQENCGIFPLSPPTKQCFTSPAMMNN